MNTKRNPKGCILRSGFIASAIMILVFLTSSCSNGSGQSGTSSFESESNDTGSGLATGSGNNPAVNFAIADTENVSAASLAMIDAGELMDSGLTSAFFNSELNCEEGWVSTSFEFTADGEVSSTLCDETRFEAQFELRDNVLLISEATFDGEAATAGNLEYWGLLALEGLEGQWLGCYATIEVEESLEAGKAPLLAEVVAPQPASLMFDCSEPMYWFHDELQALAFRQEPLEI